MTDWKSIQERDQQSATRAGVTVEVLREIRDSENLIRLTAKTIEYLGHIRSNVSVLAVIVVINFIATVIGALYFLNHFE